MHHQHHLHSWLMSLYILDHSRQRKLVPRFSERHAWQSNDENQFQKEANRYNERKHLLGNNISFISYECYANIRTSKLSSLFKPSAKMSKGFSSSHIEHKKCARRISIITSRLHISSMKIENRLTA